MSFVDRIFGKGKSNNDKNNNINDDESPLVFISYSSYDKKIAYEVCDFLESHNVKCSILPRDVKQDVEIRQQIRDIITKTELVLLIFSENSNASPKVEDQISTAFQHYKTILRFEIDDSIPTDHMRFYLMNNQGINAYPNPEKYFNSLLEEISQLIDDEDIIDWGEIKENGSEDIKNSIRKSSIIKDNATNELKTTEKPFKAYDGEGQYIFISYKHADTDLIVPIIKRFHERGYNVWFDHGLQYGEDYDDLIDLKIDGSSLFVIFITENVIEGAYNSDEYMKKELDVAIDTNTKIFPIFLHQVGLKGKYRMQLKGKHSIFLHEYDNEDKFIDDCITAFKEDFEMDPSI